MKDNTPQAMKKAVMIEWVDSQFEPQGWKHINEVKITIPHIHSVGFIIKQSKKAIVISQSIDIKNNHISNDFTIPKCSIIKITRLK